MNWFDAENRLIKIIRLLENKSELSTDELSKRLDVSTKTIQNDIKDINSDLKDSALIDLNRSVARLFITDFPRYKQQRNGIERRNSNFDSPQMRMAFIIDTLMSSDSPYLIDELAYAMNISRSTLIKDMTKLKTILKNYHLTIAGQSSIGISLIGDELNLRFFVLDNNYNIICAESTLSPEITAKVKLDLAPLKLDKVVVENFIRYITLSLNRTVQGHGLVKLDSKYQELGNHYYFKFLQKSLDSLERILKINFPRNERLFLIIPLISMRTPYDISSLESNIIVSDDILQITKEIISTIQDEMEITLDEKNSDIIDEFVYHNYFLTNRLRYGLPIQNQTNDDIKEKYTVAYHMSMIAKNVIEKRMSVKIPESEVDYLTAYFQIFLTEQNHIRHPYKVALICGTGRARAKLIIAQLQKILAREAVIDIFVYNEQFSEQKLINHDLLISTVKIDISIQIPIIYINEVVDETYLRNSIERIFYAHQLQIPMLHGVKSIVFSLLSPDKITIFDSSFNYLQAVHHMVNKLITADLVEKKFWQRILSREEKSSMVLDSHVAFPHARYDNNTEVVISLGLIPNKLNDSLYPDLQIIFLVGIPADSEDDGILVKIYDEIISMSSQKKIIGDISKMNSYNDILMYFIKDCNIFN